MDPPDPVPAMVVTAVERLSSVPCFAPPICEEAVEPPSDPVIPQIRSVRVVVLVVQVIPSGDVRTIPETLSLPPDTTKILFANVTS